MSNTPQDDTAYHGLTDERLKELLALHGLREFPARNSLVTRFIPWMAIHREFSQLSWPLCVSLYIRSGKIRIGEDTYTGPCSVKVPSVLAFRILEPLEADGGYSMTFTEPLPAPNPVPKQTPANMMTCKRCMGSGRVRSHLYGKADPLRNHVPVLEECPDCGGQGYV